MTRGLLATWLLWASLLVGNVPDGVLGGGNLRYKTESSRSSIIAKDTKLFQAIDSSSSTNNKRVLVEDALRQFVGSAVIQIPELKASQDTWLGTLGFNVTDFICFGISFSGININTFQGETGADAFHLQVSDLLFNCTMNIGWDYERVYGVGTALVNSDKNYLSAKVSLDPSVSVTAEDEDACDGTKIDIADLEFEGTMSFKVMNLYRGFIRRVAEKKIEEIFCKLMTEEMIGFGLDFLNAKLDEVSGDLPSWRWEPLYSETGAMVAPDVEGKFLNLQDANDKAATVMKMALDYFNDLLATQRDDPQLQKKDIGINIVLREQLLNENGAFDALDFLNDPDIQSQVVRTPLVDINITLIDLEVFGLDNATVFTPISVLGNRTVQNQIKWSSITAHAQLMIEVRASTNADSIFANAESLPAVIENVKVIVGADNIDATLSLTVPMERSQVEALPMGFFLNWESLPPCIPPLFYDAEVSGLHLTIGKIHDPVFEGIQSQDIDHIVKKSTEIGLATFEDSILQAIPHIFQLQVRDKLNSMTEYQCEAVSRSGGQRRLVEDFEEETGRALYINMACAVLCVCTAALAAGLTMGLLSLDELMLLIKQRAGGTEKERKAAASLLPIVRQHHLLLVTLLLMNAMANEALPLFLDKIVPGYLAVILSVTLVLFFGEIIPSAVFTGPDQIKLASSLAPLVKTVMFILSPIAYPIAKILDLVLHEGEHDSMYNRGELSALVRIQYEEHLASKRRRKSEIKRNLKDLQSMESSDSYGSRLSSSSAVPPEIRQTLRAIKRQISHDHNRRRHQDLHVDEVTMVEGALQMRTTPATDVFTPWSHVFAIPSDMKLTERNIVRIYRSGFSRIPVYEKNEDDPEDTTRIVGILSSRQLIVVDSQDMRQVSTLPLAIPRCIAPDTTLVDLINIFQTGGVTGSHMALVCSRPEEANLALKEGKPIPDHAGLMGVVTLEDVLESLIQEQIYDEYDRAERKHLDLARWGFQRWKMYVRTKKTQRGERYESGTTGEPKLLRVVDEAVARDHGEEESPPTEHTSLLSRFNPFK